MRTKLWEDSLQGVLEGEVESLGGEVPNHIGEVSSPKRQKALLVVDPLEAVSDAAVSSHLTILDQRIGILSLNDKLHSLNWCGKSLGDSSRNSTRRKVVSKCFKVILVGFRFLFLSNRHISRHGKSLATESFKLQ